MENKLNLIRMASGGFGRGIGSLMLIALFTGVCMAVPAKLGGAEMKSKGLHDQVSGLKGWKVSGNKNAVKAWEVGGEVGTVIALANGASLETKMDLPALSDREEALKGKWKGVLSVDTYGVVNAAGAGAGVKWELEIVAAQGEVVYHRDFEAKGAAVSKLGADGVVRPQRVTVELDGKLIDQLMTAGFQLRLSVKGKGGVVFGGLEVARLHEQPTRKMEAKPNGQAGPDKVNVGSLGFQMLVEHRQRVCGVYNIVEGGPAAKAGLEWGDVLVGVNGVEFGVNNANPGWDWYNHGHAATVGRAILAGLEGDKPKKRMTLNVLRDGELIKLNVNLPDVYLEEDFFTKNSGERMKADMLSFLIKNQKKDGSFGCPIRTTFAALSLLSERDEKNAESIFRAVNWMLNKYPNAENFGGLGFWHASYAGILYCEYYLATGDKRVLPRIQGIHDWVLTGAHTSKWGMACLGHGVNGLPYGNKALMAPTSHLLVFDGLAEKCGLKMQLWDTLLPYTEHCWSDPKKGGHGSMGYNASYKDKAQFWSRTGQCALACAIRGERKDMQDAMTGFMRGNFPFYRNSHAYGEPGGAWGMLSLGFAHPVAYKEVMNAYRWEFALSWEPGYGMKFSQPHMGAPYMGQDDLLNAAYPLVFNAGKKTLQMTGGDEKNWLDVSGFEKPLSDVVLRRTNAGKVRLECRVPGNAIFYTHDGSDPSESSIRYTEPFSLDSGGEVKAVSAKEGKLSKVASRKYPKYSRKVTVAAASGHSDPKEAVRRASYALDGAKYLAWIPDVGEGAKSYPHYIIFDLGAVCKMKGISFSQGLKNGGAGKYKVSGSINALVKPTVMAEGEWKSYRSDRVIEINNSDEFRFVRLDFLEPLSLEADEKKSTSFRIQELLLDYELVRDLPE